MMELASAIKLAPDDTFRFQCSRCGECCHDVRGAVLLSSLDLFRIARYRKEEVEAVFSSHADVYTLDEKIRFPILMLRVKTYGDVCCFYKASACTVQDAKPLPCRLYPLNVGPDGKGGLDYYRVSQRWHHYTGAEHTAGEWMKENLSPDDRRFMPIWYELAAELGRLMRRIIASPGGMEKQNDICVRALWFMYLCYDIQSEFWPQFERNMALLKREMEYAACGK